MLTTRRVLSIVLLTTCGISYANVKTISNCWQLQNIASHAQEDYQLIDNIECKGYPFAPIGNFIGTLDGNDYTIYNLNIQKDPEPNAGLFTTLGTPDITAVIKNIHFTNAKVTGAYDTNRGLLAGIAHRAEISNIKVNGFVIETSGDKTRKAASGGLLGVASHTTLKHVHLFNHIEISKNQYAGGLIGVAQAGVYIEKSSVKGLISDGFGCATEETCAFGGLIGLVQDNANDEKVIIDQSYAIGEIETKKNAGGLVGLVETSAHLDILNSYAIVDILRRCTLYDGCLTKYAGGLIGRAKEDGNGPFGIINLKYVYAAGLVEVRGREGGKSIVGGDKPSKRVVAQESYFDVSATTRQESGDNYSIKLSKKNMQNAAHFPHWDPSIWFLSNGDYPRLIQSIE